MIASMIKATGELLWIDTMASRPTARLVFKSLENGKILEIGDNAEIVIREKASGVEYAPGALELLGRRIT